MICDLLLGFEGVWICRSVVWQIIACTPAAAGAVQSKISKLGWLKNRKVRSAVFCSRTNCCHQSYISKVIKLLSSKSQRPTVVWFVRRLEISGKQLSIFKMLNIAKLNRLLLNATSWLLGLSKFQTWESSMIVKSYISFFIHVIRLSHCYTILIMFYNC